MTDRNPMRVLDCKEQSCLEASEGAPTTLTCLCDSCTDRFDKVKKYLDTVGIKYIVDERLVRGLDYYTNTAFTNNICNWKNEYDISTYSCFKWYI